MPPLTIAKPSLILPNRPKLITPFDEGFYDELQEAIRPSYKRKKYKKSSSRTFTFVGSCTSTSSSLDFSSLSAGAVAAGDALFYIDFAINSGSLPTSVIPSGFSNHLDDPGATSPRAMISSKKASGSEGSVTGMNGSVRNNKIGLVYRPSISFTTINANDIASDINTGDPTLQTCDPSAETSAVILLGISGIDNATAAFSTFSPASDGTVANSSNDLLVGHKLYNTSPQSTQVDMADLGVINWLASLYFTAS